MNQSHDKISLRPTWRARLLLGLAAGWLTMCGVDQAAGMDEGSAIELAREYLASDDEDDRQELSQNLAAYDGDISAVLKQLARRRYRPVAAGYHPREPFRVEELAEKHPRDLLYFTVPEGYRPNRRTGLIVYLHGGGSSTERDAPRYIMDFPEKGEEDDSIELGDVFAATGMIAVGPSAPWDEDSSYRWCLEEADEYLVDVVAECSARFNIDPDRVILFGHSMGGFGAYHHIQRQPDRFAAVLMNAGSWSLAYLPTLRGTPLGIVQGVRDARRGERWHYTDVEYARWTHKLLSELELEHTYFEHPGEHSLRYGRKYIAQYLQSVRAARRNPSHPRVTLASPVGFDRSYCFPVQHNRWLSLVEAADGELEYDELRSNGAADFDEWRLRHRTCQQTGASLDAVNRGDNTIDVTTENVTRFTVWLDAGLVDFARPLIIVVDGEPRFKGKVRPSLLTALESYERRHDWGLIYPAKVELTLDEP